MKLRQLLIAIVFVSFAAVAAHADGIPPDGRIIVGHGSDPGGPASCGLSFKIHLNGHGGGIENCVNSSGEDWIGLEIFATIPLGDTVTCVTSTSSSVAVFSTSTCSTPIIVNTFDHKEIIEFELFGGAGIPAGSLFFINLNNGGSADPNGAGGWSSFEGGNLDAFAVVQTPEPGALFLLASGLGLMTLKRRQSASTKSI